MQEVAALAVSVPSLVTAVAGVGPVGSGSSSNGRK